MQSTCESLKSFELILIRLYDTLYNMDSPIKTSKEL